MIYLDHAATSPVNPEVLKTYQELLNRSFANSESIYDLGFKIKRQLDKSRQALADFFGVKANDLIFTSGASEANAMAIKGYALANQEKGKHIITTTIEHSSVLEACKQLEDYFGYDVTYLDVNNQGFIDLNDLKQALRDDTVLVSIMMVNNEIGSIQPLPEISRIVREAKAVLHVDCVQALGKIDVDFNLFDMASFSAHKINGLKGSGLLYKKNHLKMMPLINGGSQEFGLRGGTSNALTQMLFAKTVRLAYQNMHREAKRIANLNQYLRDELMKIEDCKIISPDNGSPYIISFACKNVPSEIMMNGLVAKEIYVSARSTCHSRDDSYSYVLDAIGANEQVQKSVIRMSLGYENTQVQIDKVLETIRELVNHVRSSK